MDDLDKTIKIAGSDVTIKRIIVKNLPEVMAATEPFIDKFDDIIKAKGALTNVDMYKITGRHTPDVVRLCAVLTDKDREFIENLEPKDMFALVQAVVSHSGDFFLQQVIEPIMHLGSQLRLLGMSLSAGSSMLDIAG